MPVVTTFAILDPETIPLSPLAITAAFAGPPLKLPSRDIARSIKYFPAPALSSIAPIRTNKNTIFAETPIGMPKIPSVERAIWLTYLFIVTFLNARRSGIF